MGKFLTVGDAKKMILQSANTLYQMNITDQNAVLHGPCSEAGLSETDDQQYITRAQLAVLIDKILDPFAKRTVNHLGEIQPL